MDRAGVLGAGVSPAGCADASLYSRFCACGFPASSFPTGLIAGLIDLRFYPLHVSAMPEIEPIRAGGLEQQVRALLSGDELTEWERAAAAAKAEGSFFDLPAAPLRRRYEAGLRSISAGRANG